MEDILKNRLEELIRERSEFVRKASETFYGYNVVIGEIQHLIEVQNKKSLEKPVEPSTTVP